MSSRAEDCAKKLPGFVPVADAGACGSAVDVVAFSGEKKFESDAFGWNKVEGAACDVAGCDAGVPKNDGVEAGFDCAACGVFANNDGACDGGSAEGMRLIAANGFDGAAGVASSAASAGFPKPNRLLDSGCLFSFSCSVCFSGSAVFACSTGLSKLNRLFDAGLGTSVAGVGTGCGGGRLMLANGFGCASPSCSM